jgi:hypothetical protein
MELFESNYTDALTETVGRMSDSHDMAMSGDYSRHEKVDVESGPTSSACSAEQSVVVSDGYGTQKIMSGPRCTLINKSVGSMSTLAKKPGTTHDCTPKAGGRRCLTVSLFQLMVRQTSLDVTCAKLSMLLSELAARRRLCCIFKVRFATCEDLTWPRMNAFDWRRRTAEKTRSLEDTSCLPLLNLLSPIFDLGSHLPWHNIAIHHPKTKSYLLNSPLQDRVVLKNGSTLEARMDDEINHPETLLNVDIESRPKALNPNTTRMAPQESRPSHAWEHNASAISRIW